MTIPRLVGMVHLLPLPGSPRFSGDLEKVLDSAARDAAVLAEAGFPALLVENLGDAPYFADAVPPVTVAVMARAVQNVQEVSGLPVGVNVLRNDALAAVAVAAATGAAFVRVNVLTGTMLADQGLITGRAAEVVRARSALAPKALILADVFVKHAVPPPGLELEEAAADTWERGGADALIISGRSTGDAPDLENVQRVRKAVPAAPLLIGSGAKPDNLAWFAGTVDGAIVGTALKADGRITAPVDLRRAAEVVGAARTAGWL